MDEILADIDTFPHSIIVIYHLAYRFLKLNAFGLIINVHVMPKYHSQHFIMTLVKSQMYCQIESSVICVGNRCASGH